MFHNLKKALMLATIPFCLIQCGESDTAATADPTTTKGDPSLPNSAEELAKIAALDQGTYQYSVEDFFRNPEKSGFQLSPNGTYFSWLAPHESRMNIHVQEIGSDEVVRITHETERDISGYFWANDNRICFLKDAGGNEEFRLHAVDRTGENPKDLTPYDGVTIQILDDLEDNPDIMLIAMNKRNKQVFEPYRLNIETAEITRLADNEDPFRPIQSWITDHDGKIRLAVQLTDGVNQTLLYRPTEEDEFKEVITTNFKEGVSPLFFEFDNSPVIYASSNLGRDKSVITRFNLETGKEMGKPIYSHPDVDVSGLSYSRKRKKLTTVSYHTAKREIHFLDEKAKNLYARLQSELAGYEVAVTSANKNEDRFLVRTYSDRSMGVYYFYDMNSDELTKLVDISEWLNEADMCAMTPITYTSRDGLTIHGYLTLPKGDQKNLPVVINPHGGPWARDRWGFNPEVQLLANRGYAVLQMNFRGSVGYGREFMEASFKQWGQTMQNDITDGVNWLIEQGIADPERVAIYGASYGGYATLAGVTYTPDLYACAVDYVGVSNLFTFMNTIPPYWKPMLQMMYEMVGDPEADSAMMHAASPVFHVDKIKTPLLVVQGANDPRVNIDESDQIVKALRENGVEVPYMVKYNEGHGFHNEENRIEFYKVMTGFLASHLKKAES